MTPLTIWDESLGLPELAQLAKTAYLENPDSLRKCPKQVLERCWNALTDKAWDEHAAELLLNRGRALWERRDVEGAVELKRLFEKTYREEREFVTTVMDALCKQPVAEFHRRTSERRMSKEKIRANEMGAIERCFFGAGHGPFDHLLGGCVLLAYRFVARKKEPTEFVAALYAAREAYGFYEVGQIGAARDSMAVAMPTFLALEPDRERKAAEAAGEFVHGAALAAKKARDYEGLQEQMQLALRLLPPEGDTYAATLYYLADEARRTEKPAEALRLHKRVLEIPKVKDRGLLALVNMQIDTIRAELEGDPGKVRFDIPGAETIDVPSSLGTLSQDFFKKLSAGISLTEEEERRYAVALIEWSEYCERQGKGSSAFWACLVLLKFALSLRGGSGLPMSLGEILAKAAQLEPHARHEDLLEYEQIKTVAESALQQPIQQAEDPHAVRSRQGFSDPFNKPRSRKK